MNKNIKKIAIIASFILLFNVFSPRLASAAMAWPDILGFTYGEFLAEIRIQLEDIIAAAAKQVAIQQALNMINNVLNDGDSPKIIKDFNDFLNVSVEKATKELILNDFMTKSLRGRIGVDYSYQGVPTGVTSASYYDTLYKSVESAIEGQSDEERAKRISAVVDNCNTDANGRIAGTRQGSRFFGCVYALTQSNPTLEAIRARSKYDEMAERFKEARTLMALSDGVLPEIDKEGNIKTPNIIIGELQASKVYLPLQSLANADDLADAVAAMVASYITSALTK